MKFNAICFTHNGVKTLQRLINNTDVNINAFFKISGEKDCSCNFEGTHEYSGKVVDFAGDCFESNTGLIVVGAVGIALRMIAPYVSDKLKDIPVIVIDETGKYVIPILSGHVGNANECARIFAKALGAQPIITTATDLNDIPAIDNFAKENGLRINNREMIKSVSSKMLNGKPIRIFIEDSVEEADVVIAHEFEADSMAGEPKLVLLPKRYVIGIGCKRDKSLLEIEETVFKYLDELKIDIEEIYAMVSVDIKKDEEGLIDFSSKYRIPFVTFSAEKLKGLHGEFEDSEFVEQKIGVGNVCERAASILMGSHGKVILKKTAQNGITISVAERF